MRRSWSLVCHPETPSEATRSLDVVVERRDDCVLDLVFSVRGTVAQLVLPPVTSSPRVVDGLWKTTCFEAFVAADSSNYVELNFAPSGCWACYLFDAYRTGMRAAGASAEPRIDVVRGDDLFQLRATVALPPPLMPAAACEWRLGLSAVVEEAGGATSYWAIKHPPGQPDFHSPVSFAARVGGANKS